MKILVDIGGTNVRFGLVADSALQEDTIKKYAALDFESFETALQAYCEEFRVLGASSLLIATAAQRDRANNTWNFINEHDNGLHKWVIDPAALQASGYPVHFVLNDFEAATWGLSVLEDTKQNILRPAAPDMQEYSKCLTGPGTGLGLGYLHKSYYGELFVCGTFGAHMRAAPATDEHWSIIKQVEAQKQQDKAVVWENLISGAGLFNIYNAHCAISSKALKFADKNALFSALPSADLKDTLRLFHELFGTYLSTVFVPGHAVGGIYLTGGVMNTLVEQGLFDLDTVLKYLVPDLVAPVKSSLQNIKIVHVTDEFITLRGLIVAEENNVPSLPDH